MATPQTTMSTLNDKTKTTDDTVKPYDWECSEANLIYGLYGCAKALERSLDEGGEITEEQSCLAGALVNLASQLKKTLL